MTQTGTTKGSHDMGNFRQTFLDGAKNLNTPKERAELFFEQMHQNYKSRLIASEHLNRDEILETVKSDYDNIYEHRDEIANVIATGVPQS